MPDSVVTIVGTTTRDVELRYTTGGRAVASVGVAVNRRYQQNNQWVEETSFFNVTCWSALAENFAASIGKGTRIIVTGRLEQRKYEAQDGTQRSVVEIVADDIGPSLKWATAEVGRVTCGDGNQQSGQRSSGGQSAREPDPVYDDEESF